MHVRKKKNTKPNPTTTHGETDEPLRDVAQRGGWIFILGDVQVSAEQALKNLL